MNKQSYVEQLLEQLSEAYHKLAQMEKRVRELEEQQETLTQTNEEHLKAIVYYRNIITLFVGGNPTL